MENPSTETPTIQSPGATAQVAACGRRLSLLCTISHRPYTDAGGTAMTAEATLRRNGFTRCLALLHPALARVGASTSWVDS